MINRFNVGLFILRFMVAAIFIGGLAALFFEEPQNFTRRGAVSAQSFNTALSNPEQITREARWPKGIIQETAAAFGWLEFEETGTGLEARAVEQEAGRDGHRETQP